MNKYETVFLMSNNLTKEQRENVVNKIKALISQNGAINEEEDLGERKLAYEIKKQKTAFYYVIKFKANFEFIAELERIYKITDEILKFIVIKQDYKQD